MLGVILKSCPLFVKKTEVVVMFRYSFTSYVKLRSYEDGNIEVLITMITTVLCVKINYLTILLK